MDASFKSGLGWFSGYATNSFFPFAQPYPNAAIASSFCMFGCIISSTASLWSIPRYAFLSVSASPIWFSCKNCISERLCVGLCPACASAEHALPSSAADLIASCPRMLVTTKIFMT